MATFCQFLRCQKGRSDIIGDFARYALTDNGPILGDSSADLDAWKQYLRPITVAFPSLLAALNETWRMYQRKQEEAKEETHD